MSPRVSLLALVFAVTLVGSTARAEAEKKPTKELVSFGTLRAPSPDEARSQALAWLQGVGKADATTLKTLKKALLKGMTYANIHSANFPGGEIRGQILPMK